MVHNEFGLLIEPYDILIERHDDFMIFNFILPKRCFAF